MACKECNDCNESTSTCNCPIENYTECIKYRGDTLTCIPLVEGDSVEKALKNIDQKLCDQPNGFINLGQGAPVFKQISPITGDAEFKTLVAQGGINITEQENTVVFNTPNATETQKGVIEIATQAEVNAGTDSERAVVPSTLTAFTANPSNLPNATETQRGIAEIATQAEVNAGMDNERFVTPLKLKTVVETTISNPNNLPNATETQRGVIEIATQAEVNAGTDSERAVVPSTLTAFTANPSNLPNATETQRGIAEIATQLETDTGTDDERLVTPLKLKTFVDNTVANLPSLPNATETQRGIAEIATQAEVNAGTDDERFVTPLKLKTNLDAIKTGLSIYTATINSWVNNSFQTITHNIGSTPHFATLKALCTNVEGGYAQGETISLTTGGHNYENNRAAGFTVTLNNNTASNLAIGSEIFAILKNGTDNFKLTPANWRLVITYIYS